MINESSKTYSVFEITNINKHSKNYRKKIYISTSYMTEEDILSRIRSIKDSRTGNGGVKIIASDIKAAGKDYKDYFQVRLIKSNLSYERAEELKARAIKRSNKVYNQEMNVV